MNLDKYIKLLVERGSAGIAIVDSKGLLKYNNHKFSEIFGDIKNIYDILSKRQKLLIKDAFEKKYTFSSNISQNIHKENEKSIILNLKHLEGQVYFVETVIRDARESNYDKNPEKIINLEKINKIRTEIINLIDTMLFERSTPEDFLREMADIIYKNNFFLFLEIKYKNIKVSKGSIDNNKVKEFKKDFKNSQITVNYIKNHGMTNEYKSFFYSLLGYFQIYIDFYEEFEKSRFYENHRMDNEKFSLAGQMMIGMLHEINNPLSTALLNTELVMFKNKKTNKQNNNNIINIKESLEKIKQIMEIFKGALKKDTSFIKFNMRDLINSSIDFMKNKFDRDVSISSEVPDSIIIEGDYNKLVLVIINLISNSIDSIKEKNIEHGFIKIKVINHKSNVSLTISDNGKGIPEEILSNIFNPFFTTKSESGLGYGLFFVSSVCNNHNIKVSVSSKEHIGTTFLLSIPKKQGENNEI